MTEIIHTIEKEISDTGATRELEMTIELDKVKMSCSIWFKVYINDIEMMQTNCMSRAYEIYNEIELSKQKTSNKPIQENVCCDNCTFKKDSIANARRSLIHDRKELSFDPKWSCR